MLKEQQREEARALAELIQLGGHLADVLVLLHGDDRMPRDLKGLITREVQLYKAAAAPYDQASRARSSRPGRPCPRSKPSAAPAA